MSRGRADMKIRIAAIAALAAAVLAGCTTTEEANTVIQSRWIGQPAELFFTQYGPPISEFPMGSGNILYTWRGGDKTQRGTQKKRTQHKRSLSVQDTRLVAKALPRRCQAPRAHGLVI